MNTINSLKNLEEKRMNKNNFIEEDWERIHLIEQMYLIPPAKIEIVDLTKNKNETKRNIRSFQRNKQKRVFS